MEAELRVGMGAAEVRRVHAPVGRWECSSGDFGAWQRSGTLAGYDPT